MPSVSLAQIASILSAARSIDDPASHASERLLATLDDLFQEYLGLDPKTSFIGVYHVYHEHLLVLGPYAGPPTVHTVLPVTSGVVGRCFQERRHLIVDDVSCCDYYVSCCETVRSEIVVPLEHNDFAVGVLDLDSDDLAAYDNHDLQVLEEMADTITPICNELATRVELRVDWSGE